MINEVGLIDASSPIWFMFPKKDPERTGEVTKIVPIPAMHLTYLFRLIPDRLRSSYQLEILGIYLIC